MKTFRFDVSESCKLSYEIEAEDEATAKRFVYEEMQTYLPVFNRRKTKRKIILYHRAFNVEPMSKENYQSYVEATESLGHRHGPSSDYAFSKEDYKEVRKTYDN